MMAVSVFGETILKANLTNVTAWQALSSLLPFKRGNGSGLVVNWEPQTGWLMASGDVRHIRVWDTQREIKLQVHYAWFDPVVNLIKLHPVLGLDQT